MIALWVVTDGNQAVFGRVISAHRSRRAAERYARKHGGIVESASVAALVQSGLDSTSAHQRMCGHPFERANVRIES